VTLLSEVQLEQLKQIGTYLRQARQEKSILIEKIAAQILIRSTLLQALEEAQLEELPEPIFIQGFIRRYADALGLDGNTLANTFVTNTFHQSSSHNDKNLGKRTNIFTPIFIIYMLLLASASFGLFYILNSQPTSESIAEGEKLTINSQ
jgi:cytoskeletal protein RodZ